jgi:hypothetical protein
MFWEPTRYLRLTQSKCLCRHGITLPLRGIFYVGPDERLINPQHVVFATERE